MSTHETPGASLAPQKRKNLPNRVLRAIDNAMHLSGLPKGVRPTLAEISRYVSQSAPFDTVFAKKESIAARTGASVETVYRHLKILKAQGLIDVLEQERKSRNGRFGVSRIRLTHKAAGLLGFIEMQEDEPPADAHPPTPTVRMSAVQDPVGQTARFTQASKGEVDIIHSVPAVKTTVGHTLTKPTISKPQLPHRTENGLPLDLAWMTGNGLSRAGVFCLMGLAKIRNKRLSDIVTVVFDRIKDLKGSALFAYLAALCKGPTNFSVAAANERERRRIAAEGRALARKTEIFRQRFRNICLTNPSQTRLYAIDESARFAQIHGDGRPVTVPLHDLTEWIARLESGRLVLATLATERRLQA
jgi:DNA-binding transcriptional ArsR family regulator